MKKLFSILVAVVFALCASAETVFTFTSAEDLSQTKDGISVTLAKGTNTGSSPYYDAYAAKGPEVRVYGKNTITVNADNATNGETLKNIQIVFALPDGKKYATLSASTGKLTSGGNSTGRENPVVDTWTGDTKEVVFTFGESGQRVIKKLVVNGAAINPDDEKPTEPTPLPTEADLKDDFEYPEPTIVNVPDTVIAKKEYAFIKNNILVHCDSGSIVKKTDTTFAYFNCNAGFTITFTASQNIKGIAIDGFTRKAFNATCDHGSLTYLTDPDADEEGFPAIVIQDVNAKSVTLSCPKQFRCYQLKVYFKENPEAIDMGGGEEEQGMNDVQSGNVQCSKVLRDGQIVIVRGEKKYSITGTEL
ncbi:MAG: hypothetical protein J6T80_03655 [Paludibacteraceae bacterium]|nr:hypothetical protein [Paludibacteraceae bacterium]